MIKHKFTKIYNSDGTTNVRYFWKKKGVYEIFENENLIYIGYSATNLYRTLLRHFQKWHDSDQPDRIFYTSKSNMYVRITTFAKSTADEKIHNLEMDLIRKFKPRDNKIKYDLFTNIDNKDKTRQEIVSKYISDKNRIEVPEIAPIKVFEIESTIKTSVENFIKDFKEIDFSEFNFDDFEKESEIKQMKEIDKFLTENSIKQKGLRKYLKLTTEKYLIPF